MIEKIEEIKKLMDKNHLQVPFLKSNRRWGVKGSRLADRKTEEESVLFMFEYYNYRSLFE